MVICRNWETGYCRFGDNCRYEHPTRNSGAWNENRFLPNTAPISASSNYSGRNRFNDSSSSSSPLMKEPPKYTPMKREVIVADLSTERPEWILSVYTPSALAPRQLFDGELREQSFEEIRLHYYNASAAGDLSSAVQQYETLVQNARQQEQKALSNIDGAMEYIRQGEDQHPNRDDVCISSVNNPGQPFLSPGSNQIPALQNPSGSISHPISTFGQQSTLGAQTNPFAKSTHNTILGQTSQAGAFGQPSSLGQNVNPFGPPVVANNVASRLMGAPGASVTPFGTGPQVTVSTPFPQSVAASGANPFGTIATNQPNPFNASKATPMNPFGQTTVISNPNPFDQSTSVVERPNPFVSPAGMALSGPGQSKGPSTIPDQRPALSQDLGPKSMGLISSSASAPHLNGGPGLADDTGPYGPNSGTSHSSLKSYASFDERGMLKMFKGKATVFNDAKEPGFINRQGKWERIWNPEGAPSYSKDTEVDKSMYSDDVKSTYDQFRKTGSFETGVMPLIPPPREYCSWDF